MCGIVGVASTEGMKNRTNRLQFMKMGLDIDSWRGWESTGLALVPEGSKDAPIIYKRALNGRDFIQLNQVEKYLHDIEKYSVAIGHNRAATTGRGNIVDHNAHPFQYGRITLVHNGHIRNTHDLKGVTAGAQCQVDSAHVAFSMNANGEQETLEQIEGGFVFVWWNSDESILNIARNTERPLHWAFAEKENTFYWASELTELLHLLKDVEIDEDMGIMYPKAWTWYKFNLKDLRSYEKVPFAKSQGRQRHNTSQTGGAGGGNAASDAHPWTDEELEAWEMGYPPGSKTLNPQSASTQTNTEIVVGNPKGEVSDREEIDEIRQTVTNQRLKDAKQSGVPTSKKRISRAKMELRKLGIEYNSLRNCNPVSWCKYKNQDALGSVIARTRATGHLIEVLQVRFDDYLVYKSVGNLLVDCVNVRNGPRNESRIIGVVSSRMKQYLEIKRKSLAGEPNLSSIDRDVDGPNDQKISMARFLEITSDGCANCKCGITPGMAGKITWVGHANQAVCEVCAADPAVMELLGFPEQFIGNLH